MLLQQYQLQALQRVKEKMGTDGDLWLVTPINQVDLELPLEFGSFATCASARISVTKIIVFSTVIGCSTQSCCTRLSSSQLRVFMNVSDMCGLLDVTLRGYRHDHLRNQELQGNHRSRRRASPRCLPTARQWLDVRESCAIPCWKKCSMRFHMICIQQLLPGLEYERRCVIS